MHTHHSWDPAGPADSPEARCSERRALSEEDDEAGPGAVAEAAGAEGGALYSPGAARGSGDARTQRLGAYLTRNAGLCAAFTGLLGAPCEPAWSWRWLWRPMN